MDTQEKPYAGLILPDEEGLDLKPYFDAARRVLRRLDPIERLGTRSSCSKRIVRGERYGIRFTPETDSDYGPRMNLEVIARGGKIADEEFAARLLSDLVLETLDHCDADVIEWYAPEVLIDRDDFIRLRRYVSPRRSAEFGDVDELSRSGQFNEALCAMDRTDVDDAAAPPDPERQPNRLVAALRSRFSGASAGEMRMSAASWAITGTLALVAFPVAVALSIVGLVRGMDFRLSTQALSVTMLFVALDNSDNLTRVVSSVIH